MVQRVALVDGLTGDVHAQALEDIVIHRGDDDRRVHIAAIERAVAALMARARSISSVCRRGLRLFM